METSFPFALTTADGTPVIIFAYVVGQARPWLGAYLFDMEIDGKEYVPMAWLGTGRFSPEFRNMKDIPELAAREEAIIEAIARQKEDDGK